MTREIICGGAMDGLEVFTDGYPGVLILPNGMKFYRRRDGRLYEDGCRWDDDNTGKVTF
jgi:hypothetical protein